MKLELKHLSPYLPYKVKYQSKAFPIFEFDHKTIINYKVLLPSDMKDLIYSSEINDGILQQYIMLRPLSDLSNGNNKLVAEIKKEFSLNEISTDLSVMSYNFSQYLFKHHFDVFGLIEKGLAINLNKIHY